MRIAILLKGIARAHSSYYRKGVNYKNCLQSFKDNIVVPLREKGDEIDVFLTTYNMDGLNDTELKEDYGAFMIQYIPYNGSTQKMTLYRGLEVIKECKKEYDCVLITRFDIKYKMDILKWRLDWRAVNFTWKETERLWNRQGRIGDVVTIIPWKYLDIFMSAVINYSRPENIHMIYNGLIKLFTHHNIQDYKICFMFDGYYISGNDNPLYDIIRGDE